MRAVRQSGRGRVLGLSIVHPVDEANGVPPHMPVNVPQRISDKLPWLAPCESSVPMTNRTKRAYVSAGR